MIYIVCGGRHYTDGAFLFEQMDLLDAEVIWVQDGALRIRGTEMLEGVQFVQTWEARVL